MSNSVPKEAVAIYNRALELSNKGKLNDALSEYRRAVETYPSFIEALNNIGEIQSRLGNRELAISAYIDALKIGKNSKVLLNIGVEHYNAKDYEKALKYFMESLECEPDFIEGNFYTGMVYYNRKDFTGAELHLLNVIKVDKKHLKANYLLSHIYYERKDYAKTIACLETIWDIADDKTFINKYYGFCCYYMGRYDEAVGYLTSALKANPEYSKFRKYLASITYEAKMKEIGNLDKAIKSLESEIMGGDPNFTQATRLSMLYIFKGEPMKAEELLVSLKQKMAS